MSRTKQSVQRELKQHYKNLDRIEEKIAFFTEPDASLYWLNQRDQTQQRIAELEALLEAGGLPDEATPADVAAPFVSNVPPLPPRYASRKELATLRNLLLGPKSRSAVIAVQGMGGVGKTTLAIALCHDEQVIKAFPDGILWATLGPQADVLSWQSTWGSMLGNDLTTIADAQARAGQLRSLLGQKCCLLVIDDVWNAADLEFMQVGGPQCVTLVTTRIPQVVDHATKAPYALDILDPEQAIELLEEWTGEIADNERKKAQELARRLGYLPLALALAGAQVRDGITWAELLEDFQDVQGADVTLLDMYNPTKREQSLRLTFDLSLKYLGEALAKQFAMLGVFAAGREAPFTAEAASAVWGVQPREAKRKILPRLVQTALVNKEGNKYFLHLLLGDYARSRLDEATRQAAEARHSAHYLEVAHRSEEEWQAAEAALPQMRIAWSRVARDDANQLFTWADATQTFFKRRRRATDYITWFEAALAAVQVAGWRVHERRCEIALGEEYNRLGRPDKALMHYKRSLTITHEAGDRVGKAHALLRIGDIHYQRGELDKAIKQYRASLDISREEGSRDLEAFALIAIGRIHIQRNNLDEALEQFQVSLAISRELGKPVPESMSLNNIGLIYKQRGELGQALKLFQASLDIGRKAGEREGETFLLRNIGGTYEQMGRLAEAEEHLAEALALCEAMGMPQAAQVREDLERVRGQLGQ